MIWCSFWHLAQTSVLDWALLPPTTRSMYSMVLPQVHWNFLGANQCRIITAAIIFLQVPTFNRTGR